MLGFIFLPCYLYVGSVSELYVGAPERLEWRKTQDCGIRLILVQMLGLPLLLANSVSASETTSVWGASWFLGTHSGNQQEASYINNVWGVVV